MNHAYNPEWLRNLGIVKEAKSWRKAGLLLHDEFTAIAVEYKSGFYHPNLMIRILLFIATWIALSGVLGLFFLMFSELSTLAVSVLAVLSGVGLVALLELVFAGSMHHYKSGVNEALLYTGIGFIIGGIGGILDWQEDTMIVVCICLFALAAFRYLDMVLTGAAVCAIGYFVFYEMYEMDGTIRQLIPFGCLGLFTLLYFYFRNLKDRHGAAPWEDCLILAEAMSLAGIYASGNYFVVRELSEKLMNIFIAPADDIPFAFVFYGLTVIIPVVYLYFGIRKKDVVMLRVSLLAIALSVFTFKYYFSLGHPEITLTSAGIIVTAVSLSLFRYLKKPRRGYTRENILAEKWADMNAEAFLISQTMGGNKSVVADEGFSGGGGSFGGGGASGTY